MKKAVSCLLALALVCLAGAQDKAEIKLYQKTVAKPSIKAYDKFLSKYPSSIYAERLTFSRDSMLFAAVDKNDEKAIEAFLAPGRAAAFSEQAQALLNSLRKSSLSAEEALAAVRQNAGAAASVCAAAYRKYGVDYVVGAALPTDGKMIDFMVLKSAGGSWTKEKAFSRERNTMMNPEVSEFVDEASLCSINSASAQYFRFAYVNRDAEGKKAEYVLNLLDFQNDNIFSSLFYGNNLLKAGESGYRIEGQSPDTMTSGLQIAEQLFLNAALKENGNLVQIASEDAWTDEAIEWWLEKNPKAQSSATSLSFGVLKEECGIVKKFQKQSKESSGGYSAALFDIRGYTVVCAKHSGEYILVWCEPVAKNKKTDRLLNSIYFEKGSTLCLYYYKGKTTFKYRVNLANKSIKR